MTIEELFKMSNVRVTLAGRWLYWDVLSQEWVVTERRPYMRRTTTLYRGIDLSVAIDTLKEGQ